MKVILIGNYPPDRQESMERFAQMLQSGFGEAGVPSEIWRPKAFLGARFKSTTAGLGKWMGYVDKWVLFPLWLRWRQRDRQFSGNEVRFHVCDHSNSPYLAHLPNDRTVITCHDVLAIRGALGHADAYCPASGFGKILQKWILHHLSRAKRIACVSRLTFIQLRELASADGQPRDQSSWRVIHNGFNAEFKALIPSESGALLARAGVSPTTPFILHIGSGLPRKNRKILLDMVHELGDRWQGVICFAGKGPDEQLMAHARTLGLQDRIISVLKPDHATLMALYSACEAFVFPSYSEGFGWPIIEAQACGAPVIASNTEPLPEVSGGAALHADPNQPKAFADALLTLGDDVTRQTVIRKGFDNCERFDPQLMINAYLDLHGLKRSLSLESCF